MRSISKLISIMLLVPIVALADITTESPPEDFKDFKYPKSGVRIVPTSQLKLPDFIKKDLESTSRQMKEKGYFDSKTNNAQTLLTMKGVNVIAKQNHGVANSDDPRDTHLKSNISGVGLAYNYPGIPLAPNTEHKGYAAVGMWVDDKGWTGVKEFFDDENLGICSFTLYNMVLSHGYVEIGDDAVEYKVNKKPGTIVVSGSNLSGFLYYVSWYDNTYIHQLECATSSYDKKIVNKMTSYGTVIDKKLSKSLPY
jgi:hypothetical protein